MCVWLPTWQDIGMVIRESSVVSFLPCLVTFLRFHPYLFLLFFCGGTTIVTMYMSVVNMHVWYIDRVVLE